MGSNYLKIKISIVFLSLVCFYCRAELPYQEKGKILDGFRWIVSWPGAVENDYVSERLLLVTHNDAKEGTDSYDGPKLGEDNSVIVQYTISGNNEKLYADYKPYGTYYTDYQIGLIVKQPKVFKFQLTPVVNTCGRIVFLYDKKYPDQSPINMLESGSYYEFEVTAADLISGPLSFNDRFYVRIYAAEIAKENLTVGNWSDSASWESGALPNATVPVVVPGSSSLTIDSSDNIVIGSLANYGMITNNGSLEVKEGIELRTESGDPLPWSN